MPQTIEKTFHGQIIAGTFLKRDDVEVAIMDFREAGVFPSDIQVLPLTDEKNDKDIYSEILSARGFSGTQALYYEKEIHDGKILVAVHSVTEPHIIIDIFNKNCAEFNPNGSRNVREDVVGMTAGAAAGAVAGGTAGAVAGGPIGAAVGAATGAIVGATAGASMGKALEHRK
jgi:hypothetical protein